MKQLIVASVLFAVVVAVSAVWLSAAPGVPSSTAAPSVGTASATPAYVVINTPTSVLITIPITDTTLLPNGVNLLKTDATGKTLATVGVMIDNGTNGDVTANDKTFTYRLTLNQPAVGQVYYRASAAFRGTLLRTLSNVTSVTVDPFLLPPDPGEAGKQTVAGIDSDGDGVRDDVQRYVALSQPDQAALRAGLRQATLATQSFLLNANGGTGTVMSIFKDQQKAISCIDFVVGGNGFPVWEALKAQILNTKDRSVAYVTANGKLSGQLLTLPDTTSSSCSFDPSNPPR